MKRAVTLIAASGLLLAGAVARSAPPPAKAHPPTAAEFAALKQRVDQQYELIMELTQMENARFDYLLKVLNTVRPGSVSGTLPPPPVSSGPRPPLPMTDAHPPGPGPVETPPPVQGPSRLASISGHVEVTGKSRGPVYVYVENIKEQAVERHMEIVQRDRAFVPDTAIVQRGTRVSFPNADPILHNVFSPSPTQPFDLGSYHTGEKAGNVRLFTPGVVEVFCNMHAKMRADLLVVPNRYYTKVNADGSFRLENVPIGARQIAAWTPEARVVSENVNLTGAGASVKLTLHVESHAHNKKTGEPYDPYKE
jgi:plastocyanin